MSDHTLSSYIILRVYVSREYLLIARSFYRLPPANILAENCTLELWITSDYHANSTDFYVAQATLMK